MGILTGKEKFTRKKLQVMLAKLTPVMNLNTYAAWFFKFKTGISFASLSKGVFS